MSTQGFIDFLNFRFFISPYVLVASYYIGALGVPVGSWFLALWIRRKFWLVSDVYEAGKLSVIKLTTRKDRVRLYILFILFFVSMEIMWRMMFEFLLAFLQMREALLEMTVNS